MPEHLSLSNAQQYFLQLMLNKGVIDQINFKTIFCQVLDKFEIKYNESSVKVKEMYVSFLREINDAIKNFNLEIKAGNCEITGLSYYCITRMCDTNSIGDLSSLYSRNELKIFRKTLELIIESESGFVDYNQIVNEIYNLFEEIASEARTQCQTTKIPTNRDVRLVVEKLIQDNWLVEVINQPNMITLHGRALIELTHNIKQIFEHDELNYCYICKSIVLSYFGCGKCSCKIHKYCVKKLLKSTQDCPSCKNTFPKEQIQSLTESIDRAKNAYASSQFQSP